MKTRLVMRRPGVLGVLGDGARRCEQVLGLVDLIDDLPGGEVALEAEAGVWRRSAQVRAQPICDETHWV
jgi:hypothetical protein